MHEVTKAEQMPHQPEHEEVSVHFRYASVPFTIAKFFYFAGESHQKPQYPGQTPTERRNALFEPKSSSYQFHSGT